MRNVLGNVTIPSPFSKHLLFPSKIIALSFQPYLVPQCRPYRRIVPGLMPRLGTSCSLSRLRLSCYANGPHIVVFHSCTLRRATFDFLHNSYITPFFHLRTIFGLTRWSAPLRYVQYLTIACSRVEVVFFFLVRKRSLVGVIVIINLSQDLKYGVGVVVYY